MLLDRESREIAERVSDPLHATLSRVAALTSRAAMKPSSRPKVLEAWGIGAMSPNFGTPSQPSVGMASPAEIDGLGGMEPTERKPERARLGRVHQQPPAAVVNRRRRHRAIRLILFFVHVSPAEGY